MTSIEKTVKHADGGIGCFSNANNAVIELSALRSQLIARKSETEKWKELTSGKKSVRTSRRIRSAERDRRCDESQQAQQQWSRPVFHVCSCQRKSWEVAISS